MRAALLIATKDLRQRLRDRSAILMAFVGPFLLAAIVGFAFRGADQEIHFNLAVAAEDEGDVARGFVEGLKALPKEIFTIKTAGDAAEAAGLLKEGEAAAAFVIPEGFSAAVTSGQPARLIVIKHPDAPVTAQVADAIARTFTAEIKAADLSIRTALSAGPDADPAAIVQAATMGRIPVSLEDGELSSRPIEMVSYFAPGMAIFFLFFTVQAAPLSILLERRQWTLQRMVVAPIRPSHVLLGKFLSSFLLGLISLTVLATTTSALLGAYWGPPLPALALGAAVLFAAMGITALTSFGARSEESAGGIGAIVAVVLALLGGSFFPASQAPDFIRSMTLATPHGWALRGFIDLAATGGGFELIRTNLAVLVAIGLVTGIPALGLAGRLMKK